MLFIVTPFHETEILTTFSDYPNQVKRDEIGKTNWEAKSPENQVFYFKPS